jgi:hypothetical protein
VTAFDTHEQRGKAQSIALFPGVRQSVKGVLSVGSKSFYPEFILSSHLSTQSAIYKALRLPLLHQMETLIHLHEFKGFVEVRRALD